MGPDFPKDGESLGKDMGKFAELESPNKIMGLGKGRNKGTRQGNMRRYKYYQVLILCTLGILTVDSCW